MLTKQEIGVLRSYEQARDLSVKLLKEWLVTYKFKNWDRTETKNKKVTSRMRKARAQKIATTLGDNKIWHSHGRRIGLNTLENLLKMRIHDYSEKIELRKNIRAYSDFILEICRKEGCPLHIHSTKGTKNEPL